MLINNHALNVIVHAVCYVVYLPLFEEPIWIALLLLNIKWDGKSVEKINSSFIIMHLFHTKEHRQLFYTDKIHD